MRSRSKQTKKGLGIEWAQEELLLISYWLF